MTVEIRVGDCLDVLRTLDAGSVQTCVTSPPYFGLRDYGTATWVGGKRRCDHRKRTVPMTADAPGRRASTINDTRGSGTIRQALAQAEFRDVCGKCGARRIDSQLGLEATPDAYVAALVAVFREVRRVLTDRGTVWLNLGDSYAGGGQNAGSTPADLTPKQRSNAGCRYERTLVPRGLKAKDLIGIPWRVAFALQADGWYLRSDIIWHKPNPMPESVTDRPTKAHEYVFLLTKAARYAYDADAIKERSGSRELRPSEKRGGFYHSGAYGTVTTQHGRELHWKPEHGRNKRSVWTVTPKPYKGAHFATMPEALVEPCILAGCVQGGVVLDPFVGSGTVCAVAQRLGRRSVGLDLRYQTLAQQRVAS
jgi:DNA modification methylase